MYNRLLISKSHEQHKEGTVMRPDLALRLALTWDDFLLLAVCHTFLNMLWPLFIQKLEKTVLCKVYYVRILLIISACNFWNFFCPVTGPSQEGV